VQGSFAQLAGGSLAFEVEGGISSLLLLGGSANFAGTVDVNFVGGFAGTALYTLVDATGYSGSFSGLQVSGLDAGYGANLLYTASGVQLGISAVPEPHSIALLLAGLGVVGLMRARCGRRRGR
ncbi:MAG: PEP-CTERM sorting domain-containing protein, partial [Pseudomonadota bacterium]|nr:PEP-CTERM sorting domain-containing protein [Pseudomonadota bacterium]